MVYVNVERKRGKAVEVPADVPLENMRSALLQVAGSMGLPIDPVIDQVKIGSGFGVQPLPCIVVYNTQHRKDYYNIILVLEKHFNSYYASTYLGGNSKNFANKVMAQGGGMLQRHIRESAERNLEYEHIYYDQLDRAIVQAYQIAARMPKPQPKQQAQTPPRQPQPPKQKQAQSQTTKPVQPQRPKTEPKPAQTRPEKPQQPAGKPDAQTNGQNGTNGMLTLMWFVWFLLAFISVTVGGVQAILTDILGFALLAWCKNLIGKGHGFLAWLPLIIGSMCLGMGIIVVLGGAGAVIYIVCTLAFYFSCFK